MNYTSVLERLEKGEISKEEAFRKIYSGTRQKKAKFIKLNIVTDAKFVNRLLKVLFIVPIPVFLMTTGIKIANKFVKFDNHEIDLNELIKIVSYSKGTVVDINTDDAKIKVRIF